jgi:hypothetical protein
LPDTRGSGSRRVILLPMQIDPLVEWQRLTETYGRMYDAELLQLAVDSADLTEQARQVLGDEMKKRGLELPRAPSTPARLAAPVLERAATAFGPLSDVPKIVADGPEDGEDNQEGEAPHEFTWKTLLCECETSEEARLLAESLKQAGIESWVEGPRTYSRYSGADISSPRVMVAADQLEEAREIAAKPIPKEIVEQSKMDVPEFEAPVCPKCGAEDPVLEGVDPVNSWLCEACGNEWTEAAGAE